MSRQGKIRLAKWFITAITKDKNKILKEITQLVLQRKPKMCNVIEYKGYLFIPCLAIVPVSFSNLFSETILQICFFILCMFLPTVGLNQDSKIVYRRYASLYFIANIDNEDNELITLEIIHRYVEMLDRYFGNVCELDLIFNFQKHKAYFILDELIIAGEVEETSKKALLRVINQQDVIAHEESKDY